MTPRRILRLAAASAAPALLAAGMTAPAVAHAVPVRSSGSAACARIADTTCCQDIDYSLTSANLRIPFKGIGPFTDGPGGTITVSKALTGTSTYKIEAGVETEVGAILAKAKISVKGTLEKSYSTTVSHVFTHPIKNGMMGHVQYVSNGQRITWRKYQRNTNCSETTLSSGVIDFPSDDEGWWYWETTP